ncbi:hypothetical protein P8452_03471 [Trifolium repens]|nr:hypothetical protein P8452_03471 [Trifolium repens]
MGSWNNRESSRSENHGKGRLGLLIKVKSFKRMRKVKVTTPSLKSRCVASSMRISSDYVCCRIHFSSSSTILEELSHFSLSFSHVVAPGFYPLIKLEAITWWIFLIATTGNAWPNII